MSPSFFGTAPLPSNIFSRARFHRPFCAMKTSKSQTRSKIFCIPFWLCSCFVLQSSSFLPLWQAPCRLRESEFVSTPCHALSCSLVWPAAVHQFLVPFFASQNPSMFLHHIRTSPCLSILLTIPWPPRCRFHHSLAIFDRYFGPVHVPCIFMHLLSLPHLIHRYLLASTHHSVRCFVSSLFWSTKIRFSCGGG